MEAKWDTPLIIKNDDFILIRFEGSRVAIIKIVKPYKFMGETADANISHYVQFFIENRDPRVSSIQNMQVPIPINIDRIAKITRPLSPPADFFHESAFFIIFSYK